MASYSGSRRSERLRSQYGSGFWMPRGRQSYGSSMRCIIDIGGATTKLGNTLPLFKEPRGRTGASNTARGEANCAPSSCPSGAKSIAHTCIEATVRYGTDLGYDVTVVKDATADYSDEMMHATLDVNLPNYASTILTTNDLVEVISSPRPLDVSAQQFCKEGTWRLPSIRIHRGIHR